MTSQESDSLSDALFTDEASEDSDIDETSDDMDIDVPISSRIQYALCSRCQRIPFKDIWNGTPYRMRWKACAPCPICAMIDSFIPKQSNKEAQHLRGYCSHCSEPLHGVVVDCSRGIILVLKRNAKYDISVEFANLALGWFNVVSEWRMYYPSLRS